MTLRIETPMAPPDWALLERALLRANADACRRFREKYFDERGYLLCVPRWGGNDGPDDAMENVTGWPLLHALGADDDVLTMADRIWEGHLRQYTEARTVEVPFARDGMYYKEFPVHFDWLHNGEGLAPFLLLPLSDPDNPRTLARLRRFAGFYLDEDPGAPNYDPERKLIRSLFNGSRGPLLRPATALDWAGDPIEVENRFQPLHRERTYDEMLAHFEEYTDIVGDHPSNLAATSLALNAFLLTGEAKYRDWLLEYVDAWRERTRANGGIVPSKIGLDGAIGGPDRRWWAGVYGWGFSVTVPQTGEIAHRTTTYLALMGFGNAFLLTGDRSYLDLWRTLIDTVNANGREIDGVFHAPHCYGDDGWYNFQPYRYANGAMELWYWSMQPEDRQRLPDPNWPPYADGKNGSPLPAWLAYLDGDDPRFPERALRADFARLRERVAQIDADATTPDTRLSDDMNALNPCSIDALVRLTLGGLPPAYWGGPLHCHVRHFDPERRRAGLPEDVGALVESLADDGLTLALVNLDPVASRTVLVQAGAHAEHRFSSVTVDGARRALDGSLLWVSLAPGCGARLEIGLRRYVQAPTLTHPWSPNRPETNR